MVHKKNKTEQKEKDLIAVLNFQILLTLLKNRVSGCNYTHEYIYTEMKITKSKYFRFLQGKVIDFELIKKFIEIVNE